MTLSAQLREVQLSIADAGLDGWLLYDFRGINPIANALLGLSGMVTRRYFVFVPRDGAPVAITHNIEQGPWHDWPAGWSKRKYSGWRALEQQLAEVVGGKRIAMEYYPGDAVPYLDRIPAGVIEMVRATGATVVSSADMVTRFYALWTEPQLASHQRSAEHLARIARSAFGVAGERARSGRPIGEFELAEMIRREFADLGLFTDHGPNVSVGRNAANPHYEPTTETSALLNVGDIVLIDLWARETSEDGVYADQTWMGSIGAPSSRDVIIWEAVRDARDAAISLLRERILVGEPVRGADVDDAASGVLKARGFADQILHRTGHSIDSRDLHGSGPNIDNFETREERRLLPGVAFSIEPGVYFADDIGMRSEVNGFIGERELLVTPRAIQHELIVV